MKTGAIFLDRDGTINERAAPHEHITTIDDFRFLPGALGALAFLAKNSERRIVIVTNQSCIGRGTATWEQVLDLHAWMERTIVEAGGRLDGVYVCHHTPQDRCACRKPKPGLLCLASIDLDLDLSRSVMVGDTSADLEAAWAAGIYEFYPVGDAWPARNIRSLVDAAEQIVGREQDEKYCRCLG